MIPIAIYKKHSDDNRINTKIGEEDGKNEPIAGNRSEERGANRKSYVWLHPPRKIELNVYDELFVLCEKDEKDDIIG